jgi:hypothetical protein
MHIKGTRRTQRQNREKGTVKENAKKFTTTQQHQISQEHITGSQNVAGRQTG